MRATFLLTIIFLLVGAISASTTLYRSLHFSNSSKEIFRSSLLPEELEEISRSLPEQLAPLSLYDARLFQGLAKYFYRLSRLSSSTSERNTMLCHSFHNIQRALLESPLEPGLLLAWVEIARELEQDKEAVACPNFYNSETPQEDFKKVLNIVAALHPADAQVQFQVANLAVREGVPELATRSYRSFLALSQTVPLKQARIVEDWMIENNEITALPTQTPQLLFWSKRLLNRIREDEIREGEEASLETRELLATKQRECIEKRWGLVRSRRFPVDVFIGELLELHPLAATDALRREIDASILQVAGTFQNRTSVADSSEHPTESKLGAGALHLISEPLSRLLLTRANSEQLSFVFGWSASDVKPESGQLSGWGALEPVVFDEKYRSIGFVTTPNSFVRLIVIQSDENIAPEILTRIRLFTSEDNISWNELSPAAYTGELVHFGSGHALSITLKEESAAPMWKVHYASKSESTRITLQKNASVTVFGGRV